MSAAAITMIQAGLRDLGYEPGPVDGFYGSKTAAAARAWLDADGAGKASLIPVETRTLILQGAAHHPVREIIVHCADTPPAWMEGAALSEQVAEIRRWHIQERHWRDIGYHWVIGRRGGVMAGRPETAIGAHVEGHNAGTIGICLIGGKGAAASDAFSRNFTPAQDTSLRQLIQGIGMRTQIRTVSGHNDYAAKACPGFRVSAWLKGGA